MKLDAESKIISTACVYKTMMNNIKQSDKTWPLQNHNRQILSYIALWFLTCAVPAPTVARYLESFDRAKAETPPSGWQSNNVRTGILQNMQWAVNWTETGFSYYKSSLLSPYCQLLVRSDLLKWSTYDKINMLHNQILKIVCMIPCVRVPYDNKTLLAHVSCHKPASILTSTHTGDWTAVAL